MPIACILTSERRCCKRNAEVMNGAKPTGLALACGIKAPPQTSDVENVYAAAMPL
ncbi:hypothetical protein SAMN05216386_1901 [Nitrosospira briensis]|uniref:Uncharacterized protein n=1 Tax=Nitrosospira briensis TaxID=35799 RepID=A0A1I5C0C5_9PROT|nr:hypothetical protein SAMN05216386_1901 [Nitrosospira briensis]